MFIFDERIKILIMNNLTQSANVGREEMLVFRREILKKIQIAIEGCVWRDFLLAAFKIREPHFISS